MQRQEALAVGSAGIVPLAYCLRSSGKHSLLCYLVDFLLEVEGGK